MQRPNDAVPALYYTRPYNIEVMHVIMFVESVIAISLFRFLDFRLVLSLAALLDTLGLSELAEAVLEPMQIRGATNTFSGCP